MGSAHQYSCKSSNTLAFTSSRGRFHPCLFRSHISKLRHEDEITSRSKSFLAASHELTANEQQMTEDAFEMAKSAILAVDPYIAVRDRIKIERGEVDGGKPSLSLLAKVDRAGDRQLSYDLSHYDDIKIFSFGKASAAMALAAAEVLWEALDSSLTTNGETSNDRPTNLEGVVIIKDDHATTKEIRTLEDKYNVVVRSASHPVPDARSVAGANEILQSASSSDSRTLIIACISGGGSALFCSPRNPLTLQDLMATNSALLASGMPIEKMNVIRKRLENGKGGKLATAAYPATVLTLVLSDIIGDPLDLIASGPTVPDDESGWDDACRLVNEYGLGIDGVHELPKTVLDLLEKGQAGNLEDTPKSTHPAFSSMANTDATTHDKPKALCETVLVGNNDAAVMAAAEEADKRGYHPVVLGTRVDGEASCIAGVYVSMAEMISRQRNLKNNGNPNNGAYPIASLPCALIAGGETTVTLPPTCTGKGGRNQEIALTAGIKFQELGLRDVVLASVGTDGTDGPTDAAGAVVDGGTISRIENSDQFVELSAKEALRNHDAYNFFDSMKVNCPLIKTGPTGTNVADVCITLIR